MNWFGLFRKSPRQPAGIPGTPPALPLPSVVPAPPPASTVESLDTLTPDAVRRLLFDAVAAGDESRLECLCQEHKDLLLAHGAAWLDVPEAFRASPAAYEWYGDGLRAIARFCAEKLGHQELLSHLDSGATTPS